MVSKETTLKLFSEMRTFADHAVNHASSVSNPRFSGGYFIVTIDQSLPALMLDHLNMEVAP
jgi:hypothetical protein